MKNEIIYGSRDSIESLEFVDWLNKSGYRAELTNDQCIETSNSFVNELWGKYCKS